jgi:hypothetical protein
MSKRKYRKINRDIPNLEHDLIIYTQVFEGVQYFLYLLSLKKYDLGRKI